jgi:protein tyrosine/serine phosphatase
MGAAPRPTAIVAVRCSGWPLRASLGLVTLAGVLWWTEGDGRRMFLPRNFGVVEEEAIYRSGQLHRALLERTLEKHAIDVVIDLDKDQHDDEHEAVEREVVERLGIRHAQFRGLNGSGTGDPQDYVDAIAVLLEERAKGKRVLVHCASGSQRTGAFVAIYRMLYEGWDGDRAYGEYLGYRAYPPREPKLSLWMNENLAGIANGLVSRGLLDRPPEPLPRFAPAGS